MDGQVVTMDVRHVGDAVAVVDIKGEVTSACEPILMSAYEEAGGPETSRLVLNFGGLEYMNSGGSGLLLTPLVRPHPPRPENAAHCPDGPLPPDLHRPPP